MQNYILAIALVAAMLALLATPTASDEAVNGEMEMDEEAMKTLSNLLQGGVRVDRSWRKPCQDNSCIQSGGRGWKRTGPSGRDPISVQQRGSPFSMDNFKCVGEGCSRGWKRTPERKR